MFFAKTVLSQFNLILVSVRCCKWTVLAQDRFDDCKHWWIDVSVQIFIISKAFLDGHISVLNLKLLIMLVFLWPCIKRAIVMGYLFADTQSKFSTSSRWLHFGIAWTQRHSVCQVYFIAKMPQQKTYFAGHTYCFHPLSDTDSVVFRKVEAEQQVEHSYSCSRVTNSHQETVKHENADIHCPFGLWWELEDCLLDCVPSQCFAIGTLAYPDIQANHYDNYCHFSKYISCVCVILYFVLIPNLMNQNICSIVTFVDVFLLILDCCH